MFFMFYNLVRNQYSFMIISFIALICSMISVINNYDDENKGFFTIYLISMSFVLISLSILTVYAFLNQLVFIQVLNAYIYCFILIDFRHVYLFYKKIKLGVYDEV